MTYAAQQDMIDRFGNAEVVALSDRNQDGLIDAAVVTRAIADAGVEIDGYLAGRYALPLPLVPSLLNGVCCDIARYRLCGADVQETDAIRNRYKDAVKMLEAMRDGKLTLGLDPANNNVGTGNTVLINNGVRTFDADSLGDY